MSIRITPPTAPFTSTAFYSSGTEKTQHRRGFLHLPSLSAGTTLFGSGLRTPPVEDMSTTYRHPMAAYEAHGIHGNSSVLVHAGRSVNINEPTHPHYYQHPSQQQLQTTVAPFVSQHLSSSQPTSLSASTEVPHSMVSGGQYLPCQNQLAMPSTPSSDIPSSQSRTPTSRTNSDTLIHHSLQIPKCISLSGTSLADFAARMTCLFWFETADDLEQAESMRSRPPSASIPRLPDLARPHEQFLKWTLSVLSTTQVTQNVVLLALLFIYRLKMSTPRIKGRAGSEYRLLTVALMLGNKFLDDNTYTNKTWAEVSCFAVQEIHVMEVEFLNNLRYNLLASKTEWEEWIDKLGCFYDYYERALSLPVPPLHAPSPNNKHHYSPIPSPTTNLLPFPDNPHLVSTNFNQLSPEHDAYQTWHPHHVRPQSPLSVKQPTVRLQPSRKRGPEDDLLDQPAKRPNVIRPHREPSTSLRSKASVQNDLTRLPVPHLTIVTNPTPPPSCPSAAYPPTAVSTHPDAISLPPLQSRMRAMSTVYQPGPAANLLQHSTVPVLPVPAIPSVYSAPAMAAHPPIMYRTPHKQPSPTNLALPYASSPLADFGSNSVIGTPLAHTPISNSPSVYLQQRNSPYKPIRHVNTLISSASLDHYHFQVPVPPTQMHYQPLGRRNDVRSGIVPEFLLYNRHPPFPNQVFQG